MKDEETLAFEPVTKGRYSNTGVLLAGAVIEAVTGLDLMVPNLAIGHSKEHAAAGVRWRNNAFDHVIRGGAGASEAAQGVKKRSGIPFTFGDRRPLGPPRSCARWRRPPWIGSAPPQWLLLRVKTELRRLADR